MTSCLRHNATSRYIGIYVQSTISLTLHHITTRCRLFAAFIATTGCNQSICLVSVLITTIPCSTRAPAVKLLPGSGHAGLHVPGSTATSHLRLLRCSCSAASSALPQPFCCHLWQPGASFNVQGLTGRSGSRVHSAVQQAPPACSMPASSCPLTSLSPMQCKPVVSPRTVLGVNACRLVCCVPCRPAAWP